MNDDRPTVLIIFGSSGAGKSTLLDRFAEEFPGAIQVLRPGSRDSVIDLSAADWSNHAAVAVDDINALDLASLRTGIAALEKAARKSRKKLILVLQCRDDLKELGIDFEDFPVYANVCRGDTFALYMTLRLFTGVVA